MTEPNPICPFLGLAGDRTLVRSAADPAHRCYAQQPPGAPDTAYQQEFCLSAAHTGCRHFRQPEAAPASEEKAHRTRRPRRSQPAWVRYLPWALPLALAVVVLAVFAADLLRQPAAPAATAVVQPATSTPTATRLPSPSPSAQAATAPRSAAATPPAGGSVVTLKPADGAAGWWTSGEARGNHLGDSFLYAGYWDGRAFASLAVFDLSQVPRGAAVQAGTLQLMGLKADRLEPASGGMWTVQLVAAEALPDVSRADFQEVYNAAASATLFPTLYPADLAAGQANVLTLDASAREWLAGQVATGSTMVIARIIGPGSGDTLFAWDSGAGSATAGEPPTLTLVLGPAPAATPTLPPEAVLVATLTPTPANVLTAAAQAWTATAVAATTGTYTPAPWRVVTPTPSPANLATVQALALLRGLPPVVPLTETPANPATAEAQALWATAAAFLTGTPTATPRGAVTPVVLTPTPRPANVLTAAAQLWTATAVAQERGTPTPWPYNAIVATVTPEWIVITSTPTPANEATATAAAYYATAVALVIGTFTPLPPTWATPTPAGGPAAQPAAGFSACPDPRVQFTQPAAGARLVGRTTLVGTADSESFSYFVIEVAAGAGADSGYVEIGRSTLRVNGGVLGWLDVTGSPAGEYTLRLTVFNADGSALPSCRIGVAVAGP